MPSIAVNTSLPDEYNASTHEAVLREILSHADTIIPCGGILLHGNSVIPKGYLACDGTAVGRENYKDLFRTIGTAYGVGDNATTFNLPTKVDPDGGTYFIRT